MRLEELLKKNKTKITAGKVEIRKADISSEERPYNGKNFTCNGGQIDDTQNSELLEPNPRSNEETDFSRYTDNFSPNQPTGESSSPIIDDSSLANRKLKSTDKSKTNFKDKTVLSSPAFLFGNEKKLYQYILSLANNSRGPTPLINKNQILDAIGIPESGLKRTLDRLIKKGIISVALSQQGRYGWRSFIINILP